MNTPPPSSESSRPRLRDVSGGAREKTASTRLGGWILVPIYLVWIGFIAAVVIYPALSSFCFLALVLFLLVWFPWWAFHHWDDLTKDLSAILALIIVGLFVVVTWQSEWIWRESEIRRSLVTGSIDRVRWWTVHLIDSSFRVGAVFPIICWRIVRGFIAEKIGAGGGETSIHRE